MAQSRNSGTAVSPAPKQVSRDQIVEVTQPSMKIDDQAIEETFTALKTLLSTVEKLQKARQSVGDIKLLLVRLLDGEMLSGEELEEVKAGVGGLGKLVKLYSDYQDALVKAQPARHLLDEMLKAR